MIIIAASDSKFSSKQPQSPKRTTPTIYQKKKKVRGYVDRISNGIVVVVIRNSEDNECIKEPYIPEDKFPKRVPEPNCYVSIAINIYFSFFVSNK